MTTEGPGATSVGVPKREGPVMGLGAEAEADLGSITVQPIAI